MIFDKIENINRYGLDFCKYLSNENIKSFKKGRFDIDGEFLFGIGIEYDTSDNNQGVWEAHRKYLDIHIVIEGVEKIDICDINNSKSVKEYEDDYELFNAEPQNSINLFPGYFLILYPNEVHRTGRISNEVSNIRKHVFKKLL